MQINRLKFFYISLCLFFVVGAFVTAYTTGQQMENLPDTSWQRPEYFVGYFNNYLNQKVNPMTLGDILVTEYLERPEEPTGVFPLYPTQTVVQERKYINSTITSIETYLVSGGDSTFGTTVGIGLYTKSGPTRTWKLQKYETVSTAGEPDQTYEVTIDTPRIQFGSAGGSLRIVITNFGTEISEVVYVPTIVDTSTRSSFSGINTVVDSEDALFLTIKNQYQMIKGYRYYVVYTPRIGIEFHRVAYEMKGEQDIALKSNEIIALFGYPTLRRIDSDFKRYSSFETLFDTFLPNLDKRFITNVEELFSQVPIISPFFRYKREEPVVSHTTSSAHYDVLITDFADLLMEQSQNNLDSASQPVIQSMLLSKERDISTPYDYVDLMTYFNETFIEDYNEFEKFNTYHFRQLDYKTYELKLTGQQQKIWCFDLTKSMDTMITELNPIPGREDLTGQSFRGLLNDLNKLYYSSQQRGTTGINKIKSRIEPKTTKIPSSDVHLGHLVVLIEDISVPDYLDLQIISYPSLGTFEIIDTEGKIIQKYDMMHDGELAGASVSLLSSNSEKIFMWLQKTFGPWSNLQIPDERPIWEWDDLLYSMDDDRDVNDLFLGGSTSNINSVLYNGIERPLDFTLESEDTPLGWYRGDGTYGYLPSTPYSSVSDPDWDTEGMLLDVGINSTIDIELIGRYTNYNNPSSDLYIPGGHYLDNNGWIMLDLGSSIPTTNQWRVSFDFWKTESDPSDAWSMETGLNPPSPGSYTGVGAGQNCPDFCAQADFMDIDQSFDRDFYEAGVGIALTNDIGVKQLVERHDMDLYIPLQLDHVGGYFDYATAFYDYHGMPPDGVISLSIYDPFFIMNKTHGFGDQYDDHYPGGTLWDIPGLPMYHEMTYGHTLDYSNWIDEPMSYNKGGVLYLEPMTWNHVDIYYDEITSLLNMFVNGQLVRANLYMPALNPENSPTLENIWFYNYGLQTTYVSNLEVSGNIPPKVTPFKSSVVNIERLTTEQSISNPIIIEGPYQYGTTDDNSMSYWPETNLISNCNGFLYDTPCELTPSTEIGQTVNLGYGTPEMIYWIDVDGDEVQDDAEYVRRDANYVSKYANIAHEYTDSTIHYQGLLPLLGDFGTTLWDKNLNYTGDSYTVGAGSIQAGQDSLDRYPLESRTYEYMINMDEFELLLLSLLQTDYDFFTTDYSYPDDSELYHEEMWGEAVDDILSYGETGILEMKGWGKVLLSLISIVDATSVYKVSPYMNHQTGTPTVKKDRDTLHFDNFYGFDSFTVTNPNTDPQTDLPEDVDKYWNLGYAGVVSYVSGGQTAVSSFYGGDAEENVTYGGRKWYAFGLDTNDQTNYYLADKTIELSGTPYALYEAVSDDRLVIQGAREFSNGTVTFENYTLNLATYDLKGDGAVGGYEVIAIPIKWSDTDTIDTIYDDPTDLFVKLEDKDDTGYYETYTTGPLGRYLQSKYLLGNILEYMDMSNPQPVSISMDWVMSSLSGLLNGFIEGLPLLSQLFDWIIGFLSQGIVTLMGDALLAIADIWEGLIDLLLVPTMYNQEHWINADAEDSMDGTLRDDGRIKVDDLNVRSVAGTKFIVWGIANNGLDDDFDQSVVRYLNIVPLIIRAFFETADSVSEETSGLEVIGQTLLKAYNELGTTDFIGYESELSTETATLTLAEVLNVLYNQKKLVGIKPDLKGEEVSDYLDLGEDLSPYYIEATGNAERPFKWRGVNFNDIEMYIKAVNNNLPRDEGLSIEAALSGVGSTLTPSLLDLVQQSFYDEIKQTIYGVGGGIDYLDEPRNLPIDGLINPYDSRFAIRRDGTGPASWGLNYIKVITWDQVIRDSSYQQGQSIGVKDSEGNIVTYVTDGETSVSDALAHTEEGRAGEIYQAWLDAAIQSAGQDGGDLQGVARTSPMDMYQLGRDVGTFGGVSLSFTPSIFTSYLVLRGETGQNYIVYLDKDTKTDVGYTSGLSSKSDSSKISVFGGYTTRVYRFDLDLTKIVDKDGKQLYQGGEFPILFFKDELEFNRAYIGKKVPHVEEDTGITDIKFSDLRPLYTQYANNLVTRGDGHILLNEEIMNAFTQLGNVHVDGIYGIKTTADSSILMPDIIKSRYIEIILEQVLGAPAYSLALNSGVLKKFIVTTSEVIVDGSGDSSFITTEKEYILNEDQFNALIDDQLTEVSPSAWDAREGGRSELLFVKPNEFAAYYYLGLAEFVRSELPRLESSDPNLNHPSSPNDWRYDTDKQQWIKSKEDLAILYAYTDSSGIRRAVTDIGGQSIDQYWDKLEI